MDSGVLLKINIMVDPWIEKALRMQRETESFPDLIILKAALWLEKKHVQAPHYDTATIVSLHYLILAFRKKVKGRAILREHYMSQALLWRREAINQLDQATSASMEA
ncbi:MAG: hypothetical protein ACREQV_03360 [Candidatus Binatia bacterium]